MLWLDSAIFLDKLLGAGLLLTKPKIEAVECIGTASALAAIEILLRPLALPSVTLFPVAASTKKEPLQDASVTVMPTAVTEQEPTTAGAI